MEGKGLASRLETIDNFVTLLKDESQLYQLIETRKRDVAALLLKNRSSVSEEERSEAKQAAVSSLKPFLVGWGTTYESLVDFSIVIPTGAGGYLRHNYFSTSLCQVVVDYLTVAYGFYLNYPSPAKHVWTFIERKLIGLFPPNEPCYAGYLVAVANILPKCEVLDQQQQADVATCESDVVDNQPITVEAVKDQSVQIEVLGSQPVESELGQAEAHLTTITQDRQSHKRALFSDPNDPSYTPDPESNSDSGSDVSESELEQSDSEARPQRTTKVASVKAISVGKRFKKVSKSKK